MDILTRGAQYKVIDTLDGRVLKLPLTREESLDVIAGWFAPEEIPTEFLEVNYGQLAVDACALVGKLLEVCPEIRYTFANPAFGENGAYNQDKVEVLGNALLGCGQEEGGRLLDSYAELVLLHRRYGIADTSLNFTVNNGVDAEGRVVLIDFGEVVELGDGGVKANVAPEARLDTASYKWGLSPYFKQYFRNNTLPQLLGHSYTNKGQIVR